MLVINIYSNWCRTWCNTHKTILFVYFRFIRLPMITLAGHRSTPGPASRTYYDVPPYPRQLPDLNYPAHFRAELSLAFSKAYHLKPHAIILSHLENRPIAYYFDAEAYALSSSYYTAPRSPGSDALNTKADIVACRRLFLQNQLPRQNDTQSW